MPFRLSILCNNLKCKRICNLQLPSKQVPWNRTERSSLSITFVISFRYRMDVTTTTLFNWISITGCVKCPSNSCKKLSRTSSKTKDSSNSGSSTPSTCASLCNKNHIYLNSSFRQIAAQCQLFARVNIGVVRFLKNPLHLFELKWSKRGSISTLFTFGRRLVIFVFHLHTRLRTGRKLGRTSDGRRKFPCWSNWNTSVKTLLEVKFNYNYRTQGNSPPIRSITTASHNVRQFPETF